MGYCISSCQYCPLSQIKFENKQEISLYINNNTSKNEHPYTIINCHNKIYNDSINQIQSLPIKDNYLYQCSTYTSSYSKSPILKKLLESNLSKHSINKQMNII